MSESSFDKTTFENPTRTVWVRASVQLMRELEAGWSRPVQAHATENPDGSWEMTFRTFQNGADLELLARVRELEAAHSQCRFEFDELGVMYDRAKVRIAALESQK